jgi:hydroxypyruvate isomerase
VSRRKFIKQSLAGSALLAAGPVLGMSVQARDYAAPFNMKFSPDFRLFAGAAGEDPLDQIQWAYDQGFRAWESTGLKGRSIEEQEAISEKIQDLGMEFGQFVGTVTFSEVTFAGQDKNARDAVVQDARQSVEIARRMDTNIVHNVLGLAHPRLSWDFQMANAIELTKRLADIYEPEGITMVIEPMNHKIDHPGMFLHRVSQAYTLVKGVGSDRVKILFDIYHVQIQEGNILPTLDQAWDEVGYFQIGDTPGRKEPGTGEINYKNVLQHIYDKGYRGFLGLEHGNSVSGREGAEKTVQAYRAVDPM